MDIYIGGRWIGELFITKLLEYLIAMLYYYYEDILSATGEGWITGAYIYIGDSLDPLEEHVDNQVVPAALIRISGRRCIFKPDPWIPSCCAPGDGS